MSASFDIAKSLLEQGDFDAARTRVRSAIRLHAESPSLTHLRALALIAFEEGALELGAEWTAHLALDDRCEESVVLRELVALTPKIPSAYVRLFARGTRLGDFEGTRTQLLALKQRNLSDAGEVFGQLGLRAPTLRKTYGKVIDPLLQKDGTARSIPFHWRWLGGGMVLLVGLLRIVDAMPMTGAPPSSDQALPIEVEESQTAAMDSAVNIVCTDRPMQCAEARSMQTRIREGACVTIESNTPDEDSVVGDAMRLLRQRAQQACDHP